VHPTEDELHIDTPEQIALELPLAGIGSRLLAITLDTLLQGVLYAALGLIAVGLATRFGIGWLAWVDRVFGMFAPAVLVFAAFCLYWGYFAYFETVWHGQTPGKRYTHIRVIKETGRPINAFEAVARNLMRVIDGLPAIYGVGLVTMLLSPEHRRLGDYVAGTVVVHEQKAQEVKPVIERRHTDVAATAAAGRVTNEELLLIETYLHRRDDLDDLVRSRAADEIVERIRVKLDIPREAVGNPDAFLESIAQQTRDGARYR
jgi:uncharacterized RDD family membrane protein YckC